MRKYTLLFANLVLIILTFLTTRYSTSHYSDGGCDGGLCAFLVFGHALPLMTAWVLGIIAFNLSVKRKWSAFIFITIAFTINTAVFIRDPGYLLQELFLEPEIIYLFLTLCIFLFFWGEVLGIMKKSVAELDNGIQPKKSQPIIYSAIIFWVLSKLFSYFFLLRHIRSDYYSNSDPVGSIFIELLTIITIVILFHYILKNKFWILCLSLILLFVNTGNLIYFTVRYNIQLDLVFIILSNLYLIIAIVSQYLKTNKSCSPSSP